MPSGSSATSEASEPQASTTRSSPACMVASSHPGSARSRQSHPTAPRARSSAAVMAGSASMGNRPTTRSAASTPATLKPGSSSCIPVTSPPTVRAIGPTVSKLGASGHTPSSGMRPQVVLRPATPQQRGGDPDGATGVAAVGHVRLVGGDRDRRAARRATGDAAGIERVDRRPVPLVHARHAEGQLVQIRATDDPGAGLPGPGQADGVPGRRHGPLRHGAATRRRRLTRHVDQILDGQAGRRAPTSRSG